MAHRTAGTKDVDSALLDRWSWIHAGAGLLAALALPPFFALAVVVLWEPFELLVLSPILDRRGITVANETLANSLMDIVSDSVGVLLGVYVVGRFFDWVPLVGLWW